MATLKVTNIKNESFAGDQLYLKSDGYLGIGTTSPGHKLVISQTNSGGIAAIHLPIDESTILGPNANTYLKMGGNVVLGANGQLDFTTSGTSKLTIKNNGQVAIGSSSTDTSALISIIKDTTEVLADNEPLYNNASPAFLTIYNSNNTGTGEEAGINLVPAGNANGAISIYGKKTGSYSGDLIFRFRSGASTSAERMRITSGGKLLIGTTSAFNTNTKLNVAPTSRTSAFSASDGDTWHDVVLKQSGDNAANAVGIAFEISTSAYHKNAGTGIACVKNGTTGDYGSDLVLITRPQSAVALERMRIKSDGDIEVGGNLKTNNLPGRNLLFNGAMQIVQRATNATGLTNYNNYPTADRWRLVVSNAGTYTADIMNDGPANTGFKKSFKLSCTTADNAGESNLANADGYLSIEQRLEGYDIQCLKKGTTEAESLSLSFWCKSNQTGTYNVELYDVDNARRVGSQFTVDSDGTWEKKTFTFAGDTTGTLSNDNTDTLRFRVYLAAGNNFRTGTNSGVWAANVANQKAQNNQNLSKTQGNYWMMTGVKFEIGSIVTEYDHKSYGEELLRCQRYYQQVGSTDTNLTGDYPMLPGYTYYNGLRIASSYVPNVKMRTTPTIAEIGNGIAVYGQGTNAQVATIFGILTAADTNVIIFSVDGASSKDWGDIDHAMVITNNTGGGMSFSAEL